MSLQLGALIAATPELAVMPATSARLLELLEDPDAAVEQVVGIIEKDPGLTANLLKLCNSAFYGLRREVGSVREALVLLGNQTLVTLTFAVSMGRVFQMPVTAYRLGRGRLWRHTLLVGLLAARLISPAAGAAARSRAFTAGIVHDLGKLLLDRPLLAKLEQLPAGLSGRALCQAERNLLGCDHAEAGAALAENWNFPRDLTAVIAGHHQTVPSDGLTAVVGTADLLVCRQGYDGGAPLVLEAELAEALNAAGLDLARADGELDQALRDLEGLAAILGAGR